MMPHQGLNTNFQNRIDNIRKTNSSQTKTLISLYRVNGIVMTAEKTVAVGGVQTRVIVTDDGYASAEIADTQRVFIFEDCSGDTLTLPTTVEMDIVDAVGDEDKVLFNPEDVVSTSNEGYPPITEESNPQFEGFFYHVAVDVADEPLVPADDEVTVDVGDYTVEIVADNADDRVVVSHVSPQQNDFGDYVDDVAGGWRTVVANDGDGGGDYDAAIVAASSHGSMAAGQWFDDLVSDDRIEIRYIGTVGNADSDRHLPDWADEKWEHRGAIFVGDMETSS